MAFFNDNSRLKGWSGLARGDNAVLYNRNVASDRFTSRLLGKDRAIKGWSGLMSSLENTKIAAAGNKWVGGPGVAGGVGQAPVATVPTTAAQFVLQNNNAAGGASYVVDRLTIAQLSGTAAIGSAVLFSISVFAAPAMGTGYAVSSKSGSPRTSAARMAVAQTLTATPIFWFAAQGTPNPAQVTNGGFLWTGDGDIIIRPGSALGVAVLSGTGTSPLNLCWFEWSEQQLTLF